MRMIKNLICILLLNLYFTSLYAQKFMQSVGATISILNGTIHDPGSTYTFGLSQTSFSYFPRYNFIEGKNSAVSIGTPVGIGFGIASNTIGDDKGILFAYELPIVLDFNIGCKATNDNDKKFGGYFGLGYDYYKVNVSGSEYSNFNGASYGPVVRGGVRIALSKESIEKRAITVGFFYKKGMENTKFRTIGINAFYDL